MGTSRELLRLHRILVATDFSEVARLALDTGVSEWRRHGGPQLHVVHVIDGSKSEPSARLEEAARILRELVAERAADDGNREASHLFVHVFVHVRLGAPAEEIVRLAAELDVERVIVGTHGRRGMEHLLLGSTAERVVRTARCPVLVMRSHEHLVEVGARPEPACPLCLARRSATQGATWWCEAHVGSLEYGHVYGYSSGFDYAADPVHKLW